MIKYILLCACATLEYLDPVYTGWLVVLFQFEMELKHPYLGNLSINNFVIILLIIFIHIDLLLCCVFVVKIIIIIIVSLFCYFIVIIIVSFIQGKFLFTFVSTYMSKQQLLS